ncbi:MAG: hypothetical protein HC767_07910, partial [Akkermansiaceae bacterium]|nr:hypothetical protein [Akkermansiaceae bacterium]
MNSSTLRELLKAPTTRSSESKLQNLGGELSSAKSSIIWLLHRRSDSTLLFTQSPGPGNRANDTALFIHLSRFSQILRCHSLPLGDG